MTDENKPVIVQEKPVDHEASEGDSDQKTGLITV